MFKEIQITFNNPPPPCVRAYEQLYILSGIAPPPIRRFTQAEWERTKITSDIQHPINGITPQLPRRRQVQEEFYEPYKSHLVNTS